MSIYAGYGKIDYTKLDWSKTNFQLAMQIGRSEDSIRTKRRELGHPKVQDKTKQHKLGIIQRKNLCP